MSRLASALGLGNVAADFGPYRRGPLAECVADPGRPEGDGERQALPEPAVVEQPAFTWVLGTDVSIGPVQVPRAVDLRQDGRIAAHVWGPRSVVTVTDTPREPVEE